ncbi:hypothetical protein Oscil6304_4781 [Oscillatoria acuminata PCC 6304]|uniref:Uncharacterized protein n=1 Tax=Oscillatoria acuminata PCC 6304 TaxID=56110 RepID=K9TQ83_9CYAN|nr:hypothetical protein Oscil6304_4781 [Oscillatoria acuminata PCC 6304]
MTWDNLGQLDMRIAEKKQASSNWTDRDVQYIMKWTP